VAVYLACSSNLIGKVELPLKRCAGMMGREDLEVMKLK